MRGSRDRPQVAIPSNLPTHATLFRQGKGGQDLPRFSTTSTFSPNEGAEQGQAVIFVSNSIFSIFGSPQWFIDQRGGVFSLSRSRFFSVFVTAWREIFPAETHRGV